MKGICPTTQAAALTAEIINRSIPNRLQTLVQLHLSRDCNRPHLAQRSVEAMLKELSHPCEIHTADQHDPLVYPPQNSPIPGRLGERTV